MSTFGILRTAYSGLEAARAALDVTGQNVANVNTPGYTRQRVDQAAVGGAAAPSMFSSGVNIGSGTTVLGVSRISDGIADARVRDTASTSGYWDVTATAASTVESGLNEPGDSGLSTTLGNFWGAWQGVNNNAGDTTQAGDLLSKAGALTGAIADGWNAASAAWSDARAATADVVTQVNGAAATVAQVNGEILKIRAQGGTPNELLDTRNTALGTLARLTGASSRDNPDGTLDVTIGGRTVVSGTSARPLGVSGAIGLQDAQARPVQVEFTDRPGVAVDVGGGELAGHLATLAAANGNGTGGVFAEAAKVYDTMATTLAGKVNAVHETGTTPSGATGTDFFSVPSTGSAALGLRVLAKSASDIAAGKPTTLGAKDGSVADAVAQLGTASDGPDAEWQTFVARVGSLAQATTARSTVATQAATSATTAQTSVSGVDLDEETSNLVMYQHAYQGAARVMTTIDDMLDTLINKTGLVGR